MSVRITSNIGENEGGMFPNHSSTVQEGFIVFADSNAVNGDAIHSVGGSLLFRCIATSVSSNLAKSSLMVRISTYMHNIRCGVI